MQYDPAVLAGLFTSLNIQAGGGRYPESIPQLNLLRTSVASL